MFFLPKLWSFMGLMILMSPKSWWFSLVLWIPGNIQGGNPGLTVGWYIDGRILPAFSHKRCNSYTVYQKKTCWVLSKSSTSLASSTHFGRSYGTVSKPIVPCSSHQNSWDLWMFIPLKMVLIGIDPYPYWYDSEILKLHTSLLNSFDPRPCIGVLH